MHQTSCAFVRLYEVVEIYNFITYINTYTNVHGSFGWSFFWSKHGNAGKFTMESIFIYIFRAE